ncbi:MAG: polyprenyl synthetase family protein [Cellvibrionaceae bacterium]|nr:polyprenyl synthetase family protein [Cellvibrionaceae bacterium]
MSTPFISSYRQRTAQALQRAIDALKDSCPATENGQLFEAMAYGLLNGGKRIRPLLCYAAALAVGKVSPATDTFAVALECIHAYSLIHDDLPAMDDDALRRGQPTCHIAFDEATAILAGDGLQSLAFEVICNAPQIPPPTALEACRLLAKASGAQGMVLGQAIDLAAVNTHLQLDTLSYMHSRKTGALIEASVLLGAISAGASDAQRSALQAFAQDVGLAFQIQDDIIDITSDTQTLGKAQGADASRNKPTYVSLLGLEGAKQKAAALFDSSMKNIAEFGQEGAHLGELAKLIVTRSH